MVLVRLRTLGWIDVTSSLSGLKDGSVPETFKTYNASVSELLWFAQTMLNQISQRPMLMISILALPWLSSSGDVVRILDDDGPVKYFEYESEKEPGIR